MQIRDWRKTNNVTQERLRLACDISKSHFSLIENGKRRPSPQVAKRIEAATNGDVTAAELLGLSQPTRGVREDAAAFKGDASVSVNVPKDLLDLAREQGLDVQSLLGEGGVPALRQAAKDAWYEANKQAIEDGRRYVDKYGTPSEQFGMI